MPPRPARARVSSASIVAANSERSEESTVPAASTCIDAARLIPRFARNFCRRTSAACRAGLVLLVIRASDAWTGVAILDAGHDRANQIALEVVDLHRAVALAEEAAKGGAIEDDRAKFERVSTNGVPDDVVLRRAGAERCRIEHAYDFCCEFVFIQFCHDSSHAVLML